MKKIIILAGDEFEDIELLYPKYRLTEAGYTVLVASPHKKQISGRRGSIIDPNLSPDEIKCDDYDGVIIPGGNSPNFIRTNDCVLEVVRAIHKKGDLVASIGQGAWVLASSKIIKNISLTSYETIHDDLKNAGAKWIDKEVVVAKNIITSRRSDDLPAFMKEVSIFLNNSQNECNQKNSSA